MTAADTQIVFSLDPPALRTEFAPSFEPRSLVLLFQPGCISRLLFSSRFLKVVLSVVCDA